MGSRLLSLAAALALAVWVLSGCGAETHANDPRPQPPTRVSVTVSDGQVNLRPQRIGVGPEPTQQIPQNAHAGQPPIHSDAPLPVVFVAANLTTVDSHLQVRGGGKDLASPPLYANNNVDMQAVLPTGVYRVSAADVPSAKPAKLVVGPYRSSSKNDVLLP